VNVLIIGSGGREHALAKSVAKSSQVKNLFVSPGNDGIGRTIPILPIHKLTPQEILPLVEKHTIDTVIIGPEAPLAEGLADALEKTGVTILGVGKRAAQLEASKIYAKAFMQTYGIPTARATFYSDKPIPGVKAVQKVEEAEKFLETGSYPQVIKADGLAAGKGVVVVRERAAARDALSFVRNLGAAGQAFIIEEYLEGIECSLIALCDGKHLFPFPLSQDHKPVYDGDQGPNTGGMGAYAPIPWVDEQLYQKINNHILKPFLKGIQQEGISYRGVLYVGLMLVKGEPFVLEFNVRFGDPETQVVLPLLENDWGDLMKAYREQRLDELTPRFNESCFVSVVLASGGYPGAYTNGLPIMGLDELEKKTHAFPIYAGVKAEGNSLVTHGGRVMNVVGKGKSLQEAITNAYDGVHSIGFEAMHYREDIGKQGDSIPRQ
jgi:phosphoribosylamine---glycine ligase